MGPAARGGIDGGIRRPWNRVSLGEQPASGPGGACVNTLGIPHAVAQASAPAVGGIAFVLLLCLGDHMVFAAWKNAGGEVEKPVRHGCWLLAMTGFATSTDAMAVAGRRAEGLGGLLLIGIGALILYGHLHAAGQVAAAALR
ncbi:Putative manganese efflux pump [Paracidovorax cattleyae]|uniref:Putative manganese efflux pump n=1 Tax=Paracidovorax cattleyae TaxID=80868 RepID=A0A1H0QKR1_9BURK|nr:manganese efflux pump [Paracidovorax cattleyae]SDP17971.1 Putative manganese efflux pump [Paracidovorax cattleyae]